MLNRLFPPKKRPRAVPPQPDRRQALACVPIRNPECSQERNSEGILLRYSVQAKPWLRKLFTSAAGREPEIIRKKLQLDAMGSSVWQMIDGEKSVLDISRSFQKQHQLDPREAEISVSEFIQQLGKRGLVALKEAEER